MFVCGLLISIRMCVEYKKIRDIKIILSGGLLQSGCKMRDIHSVLYCMYELSNLLLFMSCNGIHRNIKL